MFFLLGLGVLVLLRIFPSPCWVRECQSSTGFFRLLFWVRECQSSTGFFRLLFLGSGVSVLHRIFPSPFSGFGSVSPPQDFSVSLPTHQSSQWLPSGSLILDCLVPIFS